MFSRFTPDCTKAFRAPATRAEMMGVFHRAWTTATRSPDPGIRQCSDGEREQALDSQGRILGDGPSRFGASPGPFNDIIIAVAD